MCLSLEGCGEVAGEGTEVAQEGSPQAAEAVGQEPASLRSQPCQLSSGRAVGRGKTHLRERSGRLPMSRFSLFSEYKCLQVFPVFGGAEVSAAGMALATSPWGGWDL